MFNVKSILLAAALAFSPVLAGCSLSTEDLAEEVQASMEEKLEGEGIEIKSFMLSHRGGNEYKGILETEERHGVFTYSVEVIYDGSNFSWEIVN